jgi:hypothetical protein
MIADLHTLDGLEAVDLLLKENVSNLSNGREAVLSEATGRGFTHLLFVDDDMMFPPETARRLAAAKRAVIGVNYVTKDPSGPKPTVLGLDGSYRNSAKCAGIEEVGGMGLGLVLIRLKAVEDIPAPRFPVQWSPQHQLYRGEDYAFCDILAERKVRLYCDHDLSKEIGHVGSFVYSFRSCVEREDRSGNSANVGTGSQSSGDVPQSGRGGAGHEPTVGSDAA